MGKYLIKNLRICRSRRENEPDNIPSRSQIQAIATNFNPEKLQIPICPHEGADINMDAQGWVKSLSTIEDDGDLWLVLNEASITSEWFFNDLQLGYRGPRSIRWGADPYGHGPEILHLAFLGSQNPAVYGLPPIKPENLIEVPDVPDAPIQAQPQVSYLTKAPKGGVFDCSFANVPSLREGTHEPEDTNMPITEQEFNDLKAKLEKAEAASKDLASQNETLAKNLQAANDKNFEISLSKIIDTVPEGSRERVKNLALKSKTADPDEALKLAEDLAKELKPPQDRQKLTDPLNNGNNLTKGVSGANALNDRVAADLAKHGAA